MSPKFKNLRPSKPGSGNIPNKFEALRRLVRLLARLAAREHAQKSSGPNKSENKEIKDE